MTEQIELIKGKMKFKVTDSEGQKDDIVIEYEEYLDSVEINVDENGIYAQRRIRILWSQIWDLVKGMGQIDQDVIIYTDWNDLYDKDTIWPSFPSELYNGEGSIPIDDYFGTELRITKMRIYPAYGGRQKNVTMTTYDKSPDGTLIDYDKAEILLEYRQRPYSKFMNQLSSGTSTLNYKGDLTFKTDNDKFTGDATKVESVQEIQSFYRSQELNKEKDAAILNLTNLNYSKGKVNSKSMMLWFGREFIEFPARSVLFLNWEMEHSMFLGQYGMDFHLRFQVAPGIDSEGNQLSWDYIWDTKTLAYKELSEASRQYEEIDFKEIFPTMWEIDLFRDIGN